MKFNIRFKTPNVVQTAMTQIPEETNWKDVQKVLDKFTEYGEYIEI